MFRMFVDTEISKDVSKDVDERLICVENGELLLYDDRCSNRLFFLLLSHCDLKMQMCEESVEKTIEMLID